MTSQKYTTWNLDELSSLPAFKSILKAVIKNQMQCLMDQLSSHTDEEFLFLSASLIDKKLNHLGSESGNLFLDHHDDIMLKFLEFCDKRYHGPSGEETPTGTGKNNSSESYFVFKTRAKSWKKILPKPSDKQKGNTETEPLPASSPGYMHIPQTSVKQFPEENEFSENYNDHFSPRLESHEQRKRRIDPYPVTLVRKKSKVNELNTSELEDNAKGTPDDDDSVQTIENCVRVKTEPLDTDTDIMLESDYNVAIESDHNVQSGTSNLSGSLEEQYGVEKDKRSLEEQYGVENDPQHVSGHPDGNEITYEGRNENNDVLSYVTIQTIPESDIKLEPPDYETSLETVGPSTSFADVSFSSDHDQGKESDQEKLDTSVEDTSPLSKLGAIRGHRDMKKEEKIPCLFCSSSFNDHNALLQHRINKHGSDVDWVEHESQLTEFRALNSVSADSTLGNGGPSIVLKCPYRSCKKSFKEEPAYIEHLNEHFGLFTCFKCDKKIRGRPNRNTHIRICTGLTSYRCELCNREYTNITALKRHTLAVHLSKRYVCHCGMVYRYSSSLVKHQKKNSH